MNYYSIEYFKQNLKHLNYRMKYLAKLKAYDKSSFESIASKIDEMLNFVKEREESNKDAYSKKNMRKLTFE